MPKRKDFEALEQKVEESAPAAQEWLPFEGLRGSGTTLCCGPFAGTPSQK
jgi:hypothetical protein